MESQEQQTLHHHTAMNQAYLEHQLTVCATLPHDWDTYGSNAITEKITDRSRWIGMAFLECGELRWLIPTTDETILIMGKVKGWTLKVEVAEKTIGLAVWQFTHDKTFQDHTLDSLIQLIKTLP